MKKESLFQIFIITVVVSMLFSSAIANSGGNPEFSIELDKPNVKTGEQFTVSVNGESIENMYAFELVLVFEPDKLEFIKCTTKNQGYSTKAKIEDNKIYYGFTRIGDQPALKGDFEFCTFTFREIASLDSFYGSNIELESVRVINEELEEQRYSVRKIIEISVVNNGESSPEPTPTSTQRSIKISTHTPRPMQILTPTTTTTPTPSKITNEEGTVEKPNEEIPSVLQFADIQGHWAEGYAERLMKKGILTGYPDKTVRPEAEITRAEGVVLLVNTMGFEILEESSVVFDDKEKIPDWAENHIKIATEKGILKGYEDNTFRSFNNLTRAEMTVLVMKVLGYGESDVENLNFLDNEDIPDWAIGYVAVAHEQEIIVGYSDNTFKSNKKVTRAEVFALVAKCLERIESKNN